MHWVALALNAAEHFRSFISSWHLCTYGLWCLWSPSRTLQQDLRGWTACAQMEKKNYVLKVVFFFYFLWFYFFLNFLFQSKQWEGRWKESLCPTRTTWCRQYDCSTPLYDLELPIGLLKKIRRDAGRYLWSVIKIQPGWEPQRRGLRSAVTAHPYASLLGTPVHPDPSAPQHLPATPFLIPTRVSR